MEPCRGPSGVTKIDRESNPSGKGGPEGESPVGEAINLPRSAT